MEEVVVVERGLHYCDAHFASNDFLERTNVIVIIVFMCWMISSRYLRCHNLRHASVDGERDHTRETQAVSCQ